MQDIPGETKQKVDAIEYNISEDSITYGTSTYDEPLFVYIFQISIVPSIFFTMWLIYKIIYTSIRNSKRKRYSYKALGTCVEIAETTRENDTLYSPVFEILFNGQTIRTKREIYQNPMPVKIGDMIEIQVDPDNPENDYVYSKQGLKDYKRLKKINPAILLVVLFFIAVWIIISIEPMQHIIHILQN